jgi:uncharacterized membrane protein
MKGIRFIPFTLLVLLFATGCMTVSTDGDYTLRSDETLRGNFIMTSGEATFEEGSHVTGDVIMTSGTLNVDGQVDGDIRFSSAKSINLGPESVVGGDIKGTSGSINRAEGAQVAGQIVDHQAFTIGADFFARIIGLFCVMPLVILGSLFYGLRRLRRPTQTPTVAAPQDAVQKLMKLKEMMEAGLITEAEYEAKKAEVLTAM